MKIDTHQHYWHYRAEDFPWIDAAMPALRRDCLPADCAAALHSAAVDAVVAVQARTRAEETDFLLRIADTHPQVIGVVGWADLAAPDLEHQLARWSEHGAFKGLRHIVQDETDVGAWLAHAGHNAGLCALQQRGLVYELLLFEHQLPGALSFCARHDRHWLVLDHLGKPAMRDWGHTPAAAQRWRASLRALAALPHVLCKLSGLVTEADWRSQPGVRPQDAAHILSCFDQALEAFGPERLLYGSDWPVCQLAAPYADVHGLAHSWASTRLSAAEQDAFWHGNAVRCYGLDVRALRN